MALSGTQKFCGLVVTTSQFANITTLKAHGETDQKIAQLIGEGMLEACAASLQSSAAAPAPVRASPASNIVTAEQKEKLTQLFHYYVQSGVSEGDAVTQVQALFTGGGHADGRLDATLQSMKEVDPEYIMEQAVALRTEPGGLFNVGNTCWLNSTLQAFFMNEGPYFEALVQQLGNRDNLDYSNRATKLLQILQYSNHPLPDSDEERLDINRMIYTQTQAFVEDLYKENGALLAGKGSQEDAGEGLQALINYLGLYDVTSKQSPIRFSELRHGLKTGTENITEERTPLPSLKQTDIRSPANSVKELLAQFHRRSEMLTGEDGCNFGREASDVEDTLKVSYLTVGETLPKVGDTFPLSAPRFRTELDEASIPSSHKDLTPIMFDPEITLPLYDADGSHTESIVTLQLQRIVCHNGNSAQSGHYITYTRNDDGTYTEYNDSEVTAGFSIAQIQAALSTEGYLATYKVAEVKRPNPGDSEDSILSLIVANSQTDDDSGQGSLGATPPPSSAAGGAPRGASPMSQLESVDSVTLAGLRSLGYTVEYLAAMKEALGQEDFQDFVINVLSPDEDEFFDALSGPGSPVAGSKE